MQLWHLIVSGSNRKVQGKTTSKREFWGRLRAITPHYNSDKCFTAAYHCNENPSPGKRPRPGPEQLWICQWDVPYAALAILHKLFMFPLPHQVQALNTPLCVTVNPDTLCSGVVFILESNSSSFKLYSRMTLKTK